MRRFALAALLAFVALPSGAAERWETLPPTPGAIPYAALLILPKVSHFGGMQPAHAPEDDALSRLSAC